MGENDPVSFIQEALQSFNPLFIIIINNWRTRKKLIIPSEDYILPTK